VSAPAKLSPGVDGDARAAAADARLHGLPGLVAPHGGEEVDLGVAPAELRERDAAAPGGDHAGIGEVDDVPGAEDAVDAPQRDVLDVAHDGDPRRWHAGGISHDALRRASSGSQSTLAGGGLFTS
jgi:hypothetical protein